MIRNDEGASLGREAHPFVNSYRRTVVPSYRPAAYTFFPASSYFAS